MKNQQVKPVFNNIGNVNIIKTMIGNRIKLARNHRHRSQQWLAEEVGIKQSSVSLWELGRTDPTTENLSRIAQVLDVNFEWLSTGRGEMEITYQPVSVRLAEAHAHDRHLGIDDRQEEELLRLFRLLPKSKRNLLLTFITDWIK